MPARHLYVHVPFCARRCSYCDFAIAVRRVVPVEAYLRALHAEIETRFSGREREEVETIYLGGGTPSRLGAEGVERLLALLARYWRRAAGAEITLEANPEDVDDAAARAWRAAGVTRVSLGVQSFDDRVLAWMHRSHDARRAVDAARTLTGAGFDDWSVDLIFALPAELGRDWARDLEQALALAPPHVSAYGLTVEARTPLARWHDRGLVCGAGEETWEAEFRAAHETLSAAGYEHYEVSSHARPGHRARHNAAYWARVPYIGLGPGAHGFDGQVRRWNEREFAAWQRRATAGEDPVAGQERLAAADVALEELYLGLRSTLGVHVGAVDRLEIDRWRGEGWAELRGDRIRLTTAGWLRLDALVASLTSRRSRL
ncbi:MAG TPA: radical SAM family heme chaperone HemW [Gemmatimonadaceae bacterium]|nr:radical SAM family heme chaperone HemW [Gemmatimonadaceae bacterium]